MPGKRLAKTTHYVLVLLSGGIDSSTCVAFYLRQHMSVEALLVDYGQPGISHERTAARAISDHYSIKLHEAVVRGVSVSSAGFIPGRNALLVTVAMASVAPTSGLIALGIHTGVPYADCSPGFLDACQSLADVYYNGAVRIASPFVDWSKADIATLAKEIHVPLDLTYSCEAGGATPCGACLSCLDRARILP
jgi:7-cyano-7-deazaguanine synthase